MSLMRSLLLVLALATPALAQDAPPQDATPQPASAPAGVLAGSLTGTTEHKDKPTGALRISCTDPETVVFVDGVELPHCPSSQTTQLPPGQHMVVATRPGYMTMARAMNIAGGDAQTIDVTLLPIQGPVVRRRWAAWMPWTVAGVGLVTAITGLGFELEARSRIDDYDKYVAAECAVNGCSSGQLSQRARNAQDDAHLYQHIAVPTMIVGGAAFAAGIALAVLNSPYIEQPHPVVTPNVGDGTVGLTISGKY
jgi:hypothetical protein